MSDKSHILLKNIDNKNIKVDFSTGATLGGILPKAKWTTHSEIYYIKTGEIDSKGVICPHQSISEAIASDIGEFLGFNCIKYSLNKADVVFVDSSKVNIQSTTVCMSKSFLNANEIFVTIDNYLDPKKIKEKSSDFYSYVISVFPQYQRDINQMIIFDYIVNNIDRHLGNFGFILDTNTKKIKRFCPLFDNGYSLYSDISDSNLINMTEQALLKCEDSKPFNSKHSKQIKHVQTLDICFDVNIDDLSNIVESYSEYLSIHRKNKIKQLVLRRFNNVKTIYAKR